jgi:hypothetical protein
LREVDVAGDPGFAEAYDGEMGQREWREGIESESEEDSNGRGIRRESARDVLVKLATSVWRTWRQRGSKGRDAVEKRTIDVSTNAHSDGSF